MAFGKLTKIDLELNRLDPDIVYPRQRMHLAWARSSLSPHPRSNPSQKFFASFFASLMEMLKVEKPAQQTALAARPKLAPPKLPPPGSFQPPRYFSKGALDTDRKKNPEPIPYLLIETKESAHARPVPGNSLLIRSLCKGKGTLRKNEQGLIYLDIDNRFITAMIPYLNVYGLVRPPYFNLFGSPEGAHIPVIPGREASLHYIEQVPEIGQEFTFEIEGLYSIEPTLWPEVEQVWFFRLKSEGLEKIRTKLFLTRLPGGHPFHIAVAIKPRTTASKTPHPLPVMRINIAFLAA